MNTLRAAIVQGLANFTRPAIPGIRCRACGQHLTTDEVGIHQPCQLPDEIERAVREWLSDFPNDNEQRKAVSALEAQGWTFDALGPEDFTAIAGALRAAMAERLQT